MSESVTVHERPGVYSSYRVSSAVRGKMGRKTVGLVAVNTVVTPLKEVVVTSFSQGLTAFGAGTMANLIGTVLEHGAAAVVAVAVASAAGYEDGIGVLEEMDGVDILICDSTDEDVHEMLRDSVVVSSANRRERIAVVAGASDETVSQMVARGEDLNSERVVLVAPGDLKIAAAVAGVIAQELDPAIPLGGGELSDVVVSTQYSENELDLLILGGVTPVEYRSGVTSVVRGVTTRTKTGGVADATWRELSTILIVDNVIPAVRGALAAKFKRAKNTAQSRGAIRSQVVLELENKKNGEIITDYNGVVVEADASDPTVCVVDFSFAVASALNQIWISAYVTV